jgi:hypothetical protein
MQKHKFGIRCLDTLFVQPVPYPVENEKYCIRRFMRRTQWNALRDPQIPPNVKIHDRCNVSRRAFSANHTGPTQV